MESANLTLEQKSINKANLAIRSLWCKALSDGTFFNIPRLHRWVRQEYKRGHCRQNRQIVYQGQGYKCKRINRYTVQLSIQSATPRVPIILTVRTNRIITGQIRVIRKDSGNLEIHNLETLMNLDYFKLLNRESSIGVDRGYTEVLATSTGMMLGDGFGKQLTRKTDRITSIGQHKNKLWSLALVKFKDKNPLKAKRIIENNLNNKTELKRRNRDDSYVETIVNTSVKIATQLTDHLIYEDLTSDIPDRRKHMSRRAKNRLHHWQKGTVVERLKVWANRNHTHLTCINCAYSLQVDAATGTLLGSRSGDRAGPLYGGRVAGRPKCGRSDLTSSA
ncbi:transposase [Calothrix sp. NIES-4071]|nr:transposase [Calothrix sp. NIES-4071]BAZ63025.1 transposase [Calothrix sp. NIES-4105]